VKVWIYRGEILPERRPEVELRRPPRPSEPAPVGGAANGPDTDRTVVIPTKAPRPVVTRRDTDVNA